MIGKTELGTLEITRESRRPVSPDAVFEYHCSFHERRLNDHPYEAVVHHRYGDGKLMLVMKAIAALVADNHVLAQLPRNRAQCAECGGHRRVQVPA
jgi:hypothetical protein